MHELSLAHHMVELIDAAAEQQDFRRARVVRVEVGALACVEAQALAWAFESASQGSRAEGAELVLTVVPGSGECPACGLAQPLQTLYDACTACRHLPLRLISGTQMRIIDLDVA